MRSGRRRPWEQTRVTRWRRQTSGVKLFSVAMKNFSNSSVVPPPRSLRQIPLSLYLFLSLSLSLSLSLQQLERVQKTLKPSPLSLALPRALVSRTWVVPSMSLSLPVVVTVFLCD